MARKQNQAPAAPSVVSVASVAAQVVDDELELEPLPRGHRKPVNIGELLDSIDFSVENVVQAAAENAGLFMDAADYRVGVMRKRAAAKMAWEVAAAKCEMQVRKDAAESGDKVTEAAIKALVLLDEHVACLQRQFQAADELDEHGRLVVEAFRMRRDALRVIGDLVRDELALSRAAEQGREKARAARERLRERFPGGQ